MSVDDSLTLEILKSLRADMSGLRTDVRDIAFRVTQMDLGIAGIRSDLVHNYADYARQQVSIDRMNARIERIERRLDLVDDTTAGT
jgi:hypothetical protein